MGDALDRLRIPSEANSYWFLEWHVFASGPQNKDNTGCNAWATDHRQEEEEAFRGRLESAKSFVAHHNNPGGSWLGAVHWQNHERWPDINGQLEFVKFIMDTVTEKKYNESIAWEPFEGAFGSLSCSFSADD